MKELTKEHFDEQIGKIGAAITKMGKQMISMDERITKMDGRISQMGERITQMGEQMISMDGRITALTNSHEDLAGMVARGFEDLQQRLDVRSDVERLKKEVTAIREALHLTPVIS